MSHRDQNDLIDTLSDDGQECRDAMREWLCREVVNAHRTRRRYRRQMTAAFLIAAPSVIGLLIMLPSLAGDSTSKFVDAPTVLVEHHPTPLESAPRILIVQTDDSVSDRYRIDRNLKAVQATDEQLLDAMLEIGQSAGLIRTEDRTLLVMNQSR